MKAFITILFFFISIASFGQTRNNNPFVFNVQWFGAKGDGVTNDKVAIQNAIIAAYTYHGGKIYLPYTGKAYIGAGSLITSLDGVNPNCLIYFPLTRDSTISITIEGEMPPPFLNESAGSSVTGIKGVVIYSPIQGSGRTPAVFGSSWYSSPVNGARNFTEVTFKNIEVRTNTLGVSNNDTLGTMSGINASKLLAFSYDNLQVTTTSSISNSVQPTNNTYGLILPDIANHGKSDLKDGVFQGYKYGVQLTEHAHFTRLSTVGCINGIKNIDGFHGVSIDHYSCEANINNISLEGTCSITILLFDTEHIPSSSGKWYTNATDINQVSGSSRVQIFNSVVVKGGVGIVDSFTVAGAPNYIVYSGQGNTFKTGYVPFGNNTKFHLDTDSSLFWNNTTKSLGIGTTTPPCSLSVQGSVGANAIAASIRNTSSSGYSALYLYNDETLSTTTGLATLQITGSGTTNPGTTALSARKSIAIIPGDGVSSGSTESVRIYAGGSLAANEVVRVNSTGVGIKNTNPGFPLEVTGEGYASTRWTSPTLRAYSSGTSYTELTHFSAGGNPRSRMLGYSSGATNFAFLAACGNATGATQIGSAIEISTNADPTQASSKQMYLYQSTSLSLITNITAEASGTAAQAVDIGIGGVLAGTPNLTVKTTGVIQMPNYGAGTATFDASGNISSISDERVKNILGYSHAGLNAIMKLHPIEYKYNGLSGNETNGTYVGFSAQNVKENIPFSTGVTADGYLTLQDRAIMAAMVNAIQEQQKEIEDLKSEIKKLKK